MGNVLKLLKKNIEQFSEPSGIFVVPYILCHIYIYFHVSFQWSANVAGITEVPPVALVPNFVVQKKVLRPFRYQVGGTILVTWGEHDVQGGGGW